MWTPGTVTFIFRVTEHLYHDVSHVYSLTDLFDAVFHEYARLSVFVQRGKTALEWAKQERNHDVARLIKARCAQTRVDCHVMYIYIATRACHKSRVV